MTQIMYGPPSRSRFQKPWVAALEADLKEARTRATTADKALRKVRKDLAVAETVAADAVAAAALAAASIESLHDEKKSGQKTIVETKIVEVPDPAAAEQREALVRVRSELELAHGELGVARAEASDLEQIATAAIIEIERLQEELRTSHAVEAEATAAAEAAIAAEAAAVEARAASLGDETDAVAMLAEAASAIAAGVVEEPSAPAAAGTEAEPDVAEPAKPRTKRPAGEPEVLRRSAWAELTALSKD
jgi:chromosome segregation ATPase